MSNDDTICYGDNGARGTIVYTASNDVAVIKDAKTSELAIVTRWNEVLGWYGSTAIEKAKRAADEGRIL